MRVVFLYPELTPEFRYADWLEIGVATSLLRTAECEVEGIYWKSERQTASHQRRLVDAQPDLVVAMIRPDQSQYALAMLRHLKTNRPQAFVMGCGVWPTLDADAAMATRVFDGIFLAEWEMALADYVQALRKQADYTTVPNSWVRVSGVEVRRNPVRSPVQPLDQLPPPDRDLFPYREALQINGGEMPLSASRSCPFHCSFCHEPVYALLEQAGRASYRARSIDGVIAEAVELTNHYQPERFVFVDQMFPWDDAWLEGFAAAWSENVVKPFTVTTATELCSPAALRRLYDAGCDRIVLGVETGDEAYRGVIADRNVTNTGLYTLRQLLDTLGMEMITTNMLGLPAETPRHLEATIELNRSLAPIEIRESVYGPVPGTTLAEAMAEQRIEVRDRPETVADPDVSYVALPNLTQDAISTTYDRMNLLDSLLRAQRLGKLNPDSYVDFIENFAAGKYRSTWRRAARIAAWRHGNDTREVIALRAPTEITYDFVARPNSVLTFGVSGEPTLKGLRPHQPIQFSIKISQDGRVYRIFRKFLVAALDPDARRWHDYLFPLREVRPGPCRIVFQVRIDDGDLKELGDRAELWGGFSRPCLIERMPTSQQTPRPILATQAGAGAGADAMISPGAEIALFDSPDSQTHQLQQADRDLDRLRTELRHAKIEREALRDQVEKLGAQVADLQARLTERETALASLRQRMSRADRETRNPGQGH